MRKTRPNYTILAHKLCGYLTLENAVVINEKIEEYIPGDISALVLWRVVTVTDLQQRDRKRPARIWDL